jgi:hypothetical protein
MSGTTAVVVVPVHKPGMDGLEALSLARCVAVLARHPLVFVGPRSLDFEPFRAAAPAARITTFADRYFGSHGGYSELLLTPSFYEAFADFGFMLVYQLDAFVFEDQLLHWCGKGYDFIGAPWRGPDGTWPGWRGWRVGP